MFRMPNRQLCASERIYLFGPLIDEVRARMVHFAAGDEALYWALRRKLFKEQSYDERGKPTHRRALKRRKYALQNGICLSCRETLPAKDAVLDRLEAMPGYTDENTRLLCRPCDLHIQTNRQFR